MDTDPDFLLSTDERGRKYRAPRYRTNTRRKLAKIQYPTGFHETSHERYANSTPYDNEIRIVASTYFGLSLFDFSLRNDQFTVNSCIEPMKKEKVLKLLEMDFRRLFLSGKDTRVKATKDSATEKRTSGKGFGKSVVYITGNTPGDPAQIKIKHPWIRLTIRLDKLSKEI